MLVGDILRRNAKLYGTKIGLIDGDKAFSYAEIDSRVNRLSNALRDLGFKKGDKVAFMAHNCHQFVEAYFAVAKSGLVIVPINARLYLEETSRVVRHSDAGAFIYDAEAESIAKDLIKRSPHIG